MYSRDTGRGNSREGGGGAPWLRLQTSSVCTARAPRSRLAVRRARLPRCAVSPVRAPQVCRDPVTRDPFYRCAATG